MVRAEKHRPPNNWTVSPCRPKGLEGGGWWRWQEGDYGSPEVPLCQTLSSGKLVLNPVTAQALCKDHGVLLTQGFFERGL